MGQENIKNKNERGEEERKKENLHFARLYGVYRKILPLGSPVLRMCLFPPPPPYSFANGTKSAPAPERGGGETSIVFNRT